jgi:hypothetical protein
MGRRTGVAGAYSAALAKIKQGLKVERPDRIAVVIFDLTGAP